MGRRRFRIMSVPKTMRLLVIAASGLAVGLAITVARTWQPGEQPNSRAKTAAVSSKYEQAELMARSANANERGALKGKGMLAANIPTLSGDAREGVVGDSALLPLACFDAQLAQTLEVCADDGLRKKTTIDWKVQEKLASFMRRRPVIAAAYVAVDVDSGAVRALVSHDPALTGASREALSARAPAASIFKMVSAAALLREGVHAQTNTCTHGGTRRLTKEHLVDNKKRDKNCESLTMSFAKSRNAAFAKLAAKNLNQSKLENALTSFGFNAKVPFSFPLEPSTAQVPKNRLGRAKMAAGFAAVTLNPVHAALMSATVARNGTFPLPVLRRDQVTAAPGTRILSRSVSRSLKTMMKVTVEKGTGRRTLARARMGNAAKSGTLSAHRDGKLRHYTWMVGYFPVDAPEVAYAAMVVNADVWHIRAGELARAGIDAYASAQKKR